MSAEDRHHTVGEVAIECEVRRETNDAVLVDERAYLVEGCAHRYAEGFGFVRARDDTAVVTGKDDDGSVFEVGTEDPLAGDEEVIAVGESVHSVDEG